MQAQEAQKAAAVSSLQACITTAVQGGSRNTAVAAAELVAACSGKSDAQAAAEAILMAQSAAAAGDLEALYRDAAGPQVGHGLVMTVMHVVHVTPCKALMCSKSYKACMLILSLKAAHMIL